MSNPSHRPMPFVSSTSANAIVSDLRPTSLSSPALHHVNLFLDEILSSLITSAQSINPADLRATGVPAVFSGDKSAGESTGPRSLGRAAVGEAEMELRSWFEQNAQTPGVRGFPPNGKGRGMTDMKERAEARFPEKEAVQVMRVKVASFSTLAAEAPYSDAEEEAAISAWKAAGGDISASTIDPSGLWITAIIEHVCEHLLSRLSSVVARDSGNAVAGVQDLLTTLYEDETMYGFFKRMQVKDAIESAIKSTAPRSKRSMHLSSVEKAGRASPSIPNGSPHASKTSLVSVGKASPNVKKSSLPPMHDNRPSSDSGRFANLGRKVSSATKRVDHGGQGHERAPSVLSVNTRSMIGAFNESFDSDDSKSPQQDQDDFDALVRSGETMKVSLTPSRLKTFESPAKGSPSSYIRRTRATSASSTLSPPVSSMPKSESMPAMSKSTPTRPGHPRSRASSGAAQRLVARGATTIEEGEDEDDDELGMSRKGQKESLKELFDSEPINPKLDRQSTNSSTQRTAPAVVLGTPPPHDSASFTSPTVPAPGAFSQFTTPTTGQIMSGIERRTSPIKQSINRPGREILVDDEDDFGAPKRKNRSEARELADFLSSTPPPISTARMPVSEPLPSGRSTKGFRSLMSKIKGGKKEEEKSQPQVIDQIPTAPKMPKRVRSSAGFSSVSAADSSRTVPAAYPRPEEAPFPQSQTSQTPHRTLRKKSDAASAAAFPAGMVTASGLQEATRGKENTPPLPEFTQPTVLSRVSNSSRRGSEDAAGLASVTPTRVVRDGPGLEDERIAPTTPIETKREFPVRSSSTQTARPTLIDPESQPSVPAVINLTGKPLSEEALQPSHMERTATSTSDVNSFTTADEGYSEDTHATDGSVHTHTLDQGESKAPTVRERTISGETRQVSSHARQPSHLSAVDTAPVPSVSLSDLVPVRGLFDHATSVLECRMLLSAILTQFGVPQRPEGEVEVTPESRLAAWLLAGGYGPMDTGSSIASAETGVTGESGETGETGESGASKARTEGTSISEDIDEAITPTLKQSARLDTAVPPTPTVLDHQHDSGTVEKDTFHGTEEKLLDQSERSSEASYSKDEEVEVGRPSIAKAARRESATHLPMVSAIGSSSA